jgi:hypothetical protein
MMWTGVAITVALTISAPSSAFAQARGDAPAAPAQGGRGAGPGGGGAPGGGRGRGAPLFFNAPLQYNTDSGQWSSNLRFNIIHHPLSDFFLVYNDRRDDRSGTLLNRGPVAKLTYLMAFRTRQT